MGKGDMVAFNILGPASARSQISVPIYRGWKTNYHRQLLVGCSVRVAVGIGMIGRVLGDSYASDLPCTCLRDL